MITLIRHGQTDANAGGTLQGHLPTALNAVGRRQAALLAERARKDDPRIEHLICSDLRRAVETARPIADALGIPIRMDAAWRERGFGALEGQTLGEVDIWRAASGALDPPGGEPLAVFEQRVHDALMQLALDHGGDVSVGVVTHGGPMRMVLALLARGCLPLAAGADPPAVTPIANASLLRLVPEPDATGGVAWRVMAVNDTAHLVDLITTTDAG